MKESLISKAYLVSGVPHILQAHKDSSAFANLYQSYAEIRQELIAQEIDLILYFSTQWISILGYMIQADPKPEWVHVDQNWHFLGSLPYQFTIDTAFAQIYREEIEKLGYQSRLINYKGFPIDTGTVVAQKCLNADNRFKAAIVSCNLYSEQEETTQIGLAALQALARSGKKAAVVLISNLSNRFLNEDYDPTRNRIACHEDEQWNRQLLDALQGGNFKDVLKFTGKDSGASHADMGMKGLWWLHGLFGQRQECQVKVYGYEPVWGAGAAMVGLSPTQPIRWECEPEMQRVEETDREPTTRTSSHKSNLPSKDGVAVLKNTDPVRSIPDYEIVSRQSAEPVGIYPHARRYGDLLFLSGIGPRKQGSKEIPGVTFASDGKVLTYDIREQTRSVIANIARILEDAGSSLDKVLDVQVFLTNMAQDFAGYNEVYNEAFRHIRPTRTTVEVGALPTPIAVEFKVIARP